MRTNISVDVNQGRQVRFSSLQNGDWFIVAGSREGELGVKVDGKGFYPSSGERGDGVDLMVTYIDHVYIQGRPFDD